MMVHSPLPVGCAGSSSTQELLGDAQAMAPSKDDAAFELALSYAEKYEHASSSIHQRWVVFFEHALVREVLRSVQGEAAPGDLKRGEAQRKISSLFHVRVAALRMKDAAAATEARRRDELRGLRKRCRGGDGGARRATRARAAGGSLLVRAAAVDDDRVFDAIASFL